MSFTKSSFKPSVMPAAIWNDVSLDEVGMIEETEQELKLNDLLSPKIQQFEEFQQKINDEKNENDDDDDCNHNFNHNDKTSEFEEQEKEFNVEKEDTLVQEEREEEVPESISDADVPEITEELIHQAIKKILESQLLSIQAPLKDWRRAIAEKLKLSSNILPKSWTPILTQQMFLIENKETKTIVDEVEVENENESEEFDDNNKVDNGNDSHNEAEENTQIQEPINEELAVVQALQQAVVSKRTTAVLELLERDEVEIELKAEQLRHSLMQKVKQRTQPHIEHFRREINALKSFKRAMKEDGLLDAFSVIAQEKGLKVDDDDDDDEEEEQNDGDDIDEDEVPGEADDETNDKSKGDMIALSDDEDDEEDENEDEEESVEHKNRNKNEPEVEVDNQVHLSRVPSLCGGHVKSVVRVRGNNARLNLKNQLQQKTLLQSSEMVARRFGLTNSQDLVTVLGGMELERRRLAAKRAEIEAELMEKERRLALERKERARKFQEELALRADDSEEEFDEKDTSFAISNVTSDAPIIPPVDYDEESNGEGDDDGDDEDKELDEEEELLVLQRLQSLEEEDEEVEDGDDVENENEEVVVEKEEEKEKESIEDVKVKDKSQDGNEEDDEAGNFNSKVTPADELSQSGNMSTNLQESVPISSTQHGNDLQSTQLDEPDEAVLSQKRKSEKSQNKGKNSIYAQMLLEEERQAKKQKTGASKFIETEAEEDEEEGRQAGLGDFGFVIQKSNEDEEEAALKLRATDLENIVDDLSDGEGDEEEGDRQRLLEESRQDRLKTKKILEALANGSKGTDRRMNELKTRGIYGLDELITGDIASHTQKEGKEDDEEKDEEVDFDDDEELQAKYLNQMKSRIRGQKDEAAIDELSDEDENDESENEENAAAITPEERAKKAMKAAIEKENYRRYFEQALRNRALRINNKLEEPVLSPFPQLALPKIQRSVSVSGTPNESGLESPSSSSLHPQSTKSVINSHFTQSQPPSAAAPPREGNELKRRVTMPPRKVDSQDGKIRRNRPSNAPQRTKSLIPSAAKSDFTGVLNKKELDAGHGLFMGVSLSKRRLASEDSSSNSGLFSEVVNKKLINGNSNASNGTKRSFSAAISRRQSLHSVGGSAITVSSSQFVFLEDSSRTINSSQLDDHSARDFDASTSALESSKPQKKRQNSSEENSAVGALKRSKTLPFSPMTQSGSSLFDKLVERAGPVTSSHFKATSTAGPSIPSNGKKLALSGRIRSN